MRREWSESSAHIGWTWCREPPQVVPSARAARLISGGAPPGAALRRAARTPRVTTADPTFQDPPARQGTTDGREQVLRTSPRGHSRPRRASSAAAPATCSAPSICSSACSACPAASSSRLLNIMGVDKGVLMTRADQLAQNQAVGHERAVRARRDAVHDAARQGGPGHRRPGGAEDGRRGGRHRAPAARHLARGRRPGQRHAARRRRSPRSGCAAPGPGPLHRRGLRGPAPPARACSRSTRATSRPWPATASSTRSSAATRRSSASSRCSAGAPRTTRC